MVAVATGGPRIQEKEDEYVELYTTINQKLANLAGTGIDISNPNPFRSLWDWYGEWSANLGTYADRRRYIRDLYIPITDPLESALHRNRSGTLSAEDLSSEIHQAQPNNPPRFLLGLDSLHPRVVHRAGKAFETGQYDDAIFNAFKVVEETIRVRISGDAIDIGVSLVSKAMKPDAPLLRFSEVKAEQEAAHALYRGAIGSFKNPLSHRFLDSSDPDKVFEILTLASLLLRMLDEALDEKVEEP